MHVIAAQIAIPRTDLVIIITYLIGIMVVGIWAGYRKKTSSTQFFLAGRSLLGVDKELRRQLREVRRRLAPNQIGRLGQLQEWLDDWDYPEDEHRHFSHLWGMYPGEEISVRRTPELAKAVSKSLVMRGQGGTGFGMAWQMCLWARMYEGDTALRLFRNLVAQNTCPNLFSKCYTTLQVDGSLGCTAGIAEMLLQSHEGEIHLLPALPKEWSTGSIKGLRARGGFEVDIDWKGNKLTSTTIHSTLGHPCQVCYGSKVLLSKRRKTRV